ncbi:MAG: hypothetical protein AAFQ29_05970, partial [Pseudomonadota bacterium]
MNERRHSNGLPYPAKIRQERSQNEGFATAAIGAGADISTCREVQFAHSMGNTDSKMVTKLIERQLGVAA